MNALRTLRSLLAAAALVAVPAAAHAQQLAGSGPARTESFQLPAGLAVFQVSHAGEGPFRVSLWEAGGDEVGELVQARGEFRGTPAVQVPRAGAYRLRVEAEGAWSVGLPPGAVTAEAAAAAAEPLPTVPWSWGWAARGLAGGLLAGPIGTGIAYSLAGGSEVDEGLLADAPAPRERMREQILLRRREAALVGGMIGTVVFAWVLLRTVDLDGSDQVGGGVGQEPNPI